MEKIVIEDIVKLKQEDGGYAIISDGFGESSDDPFFVRLHSWDTSMKHKTIHSMNGKKVRVTVEIID